MLGAHMLMQQCKLVLRVRSEMRKIADKTFENLDYRDYRALTIEAEKEIRALLADAELQPDISSRTKTIDSINDKIERKQYDDFLSQMKDIAGVRIACMTKKQKDSAIELLRTKFDVLEHEPSKNDPYTMGYNDEKMILRFGDKFKSAAYDTLRNKPFEVQIRYIFMDAWAKFSHSFAYKDEDDIPPEMLRKVHIMAAACEMLDDLADSYAEQISALRQTIKADLAKGDTASINTPINMESLQAYLEVKYPGMVVKRHIQALIIRDLDKEKYRTIADIDRAVEGAQDFLAWHSRQKPHLFTSGADYVTKALGWIDSDFRKKHAFGVETRQAFRNFELKRREGSPH